MRFVYHEGVETVYCSQKKVKHVMMGTERMEMVVRQIVALRQDMHVQYLI
jgi:hypothetical protein